MREPLTGLDIGKHGLPKEQTACPGCGKQYGHKYKKQVTGACLNCEECSRCCSCGEKAKPVTAEQMIQHCLENA